MKEYDSGVFLVYVATFRLRVPSIAGLAIYSATSEYNYVQTLPNIVVPLYTAAVCFVMHSCASNT
jgi:hypothetical protein